MIEYKKAGISDNFLRLLKKFKASPTAYRSVIEDIENKHISVLEVYYDSKLYGVLVVRGEVNREGKLGICILHAIAEDNLDRHLSSILAESLEDWLLSLRAENGDQVFFWIRQEADNRIIARMLEAYYGEPIIKVYQKNLESHETRLNRQKTSSIAN